MKKIYSITELKETIDFITEERKLTLNQDLWRHRLALIKHYLFIKRLDANYDKDIPEFINKLKQCIKLQKLTNDLGITLQNYDTY